MPYKELKAEWNDFLATRGTPEGGTAFDSYMQLRLLFDIAGSLDSIAFSYSQMLKLQQERDKRNGR